MLLQVRSGRSAAVAAAVAGVDGVASVHEVAGAYDLVVQVRAAERARLWAVVSRVQIVDGITSTLTCPVASAQPSPTR